MGEEFLIMRKISKRYTGVQALDDVDFTICKGEIHCLVGENGSGKSTLVKIISGITQPKDGAEIEIEGEHIQHLTSIYSIQAGIHVIYQDLSLFPNLTVAENIALNKYVEKGQRFINWKEIKTIAKEAMNKVRVDIELDRPVGNLSIADQQLIAICRVLIRGNAKLLIMDEPTSSLTKKEVDLLFVVIKDLQKKGIATLFISHKLNEIIEIAERVTILRDGKKIGTFDNKELDNKRLTFLMTGKKITYSRYSAEIDERKVILEVRNISKKGNFKNVSFKLHQGEILGIIGLLGSGRTELALSLFGMNPPDSGEIYINGKLAKIRSNKDAIKWGIGYVPEDRLLQGLVMDQSVGNNIIITILEKLLGRLKLFNSNKREEFAKKGVNDLAIKVPSIDSPVKTLSGGNQQRVILAKWIATKPKILILDEPTAGIDIAAKSDIHYIIRDLASQGVSVIIIFDEVPEVLYNCNRILLMRKEKTVGEFNSNEINEDELYQKINVG